MSRLVGPSPCRVNRTGEGRRHACSAEHADLVNGWRVAWYAWEARREAETFGYPKDVALWNAEHAHEAPTFRRWLISYRGSSEADDEVEGVA